MRAELKAAIDQGRMLFLSPFKAQQCRATAQIAVYRNLFVAAVADAIFVAHARPTGKTEQLWREVLGSRKTVYTVESDLNANLIDLGAKPVQGKCDCPQVTSDALGTSCRRSRQKLRHGVYNHILWHSQEQAGVRHEESNGYSRASSIPCRCGAIHGEHRGPPALFSPLLRLAASTRSLPQFRCSQIGSKRSLVAFVVPFPKSLAGRLVPTLSYLYLPFAQRAALTSVPTRQAPVHVKH